MTRSASLLPLSAVDDTERRAFYQRMFPRRERVLARHWRWWYRSGEVDGVEPVAALDDGRMVGQAGVLPVELETAGTVETAIWYIDFAVLPEFQGAGLGKRLTQAWMALCPNQITFCNEQSMRIFARYGWHESFACHRCAAPIQPLRLLEHRLPWLTLPGPVRRSTWLARASSHWLRRRLKHAPEPAAEPLDPARLWQLMQAQGGGPGAGPAVRRDERWVDWRFARNPFLAEHLMFEHRDAFAVARRFRSNGLRRFHVLYVGGPDGDALELYRGMTRWAVAHGMDLVWMNGDDPALLAGLKRVLPIQAPMRFASFSEDAGLHEALKSGLRGLQAADGDNDLLSPSDGVAEGCGDGVASAGPLG